MPPWIVKLVRLRDVMYRAGLNLGESGYGVSTRTFALAI